MLDITYEDTWLTRNLTPQEYREFLQSDSWKELKKKASTRENFKSCYICGSKHNLDLHHLSYKHLDELRNVRSVCREHHTQIHILAKETGISVRLATRKIRKEYLRA